MSIIEAMVAAYPAPEWALFFEVPNATGFNGRGRADAIAMNLWPSRGLALHGFEFKTARSDWLREKKDPAKAENLARFCNAWWLVISDVKIAPLEEVPLPWGVLLVKDKKLKTLRQAEVKPDVELTRSFIASLLRAATKDTVPRSEVDNLVLARLKKIQDDTDDGLKRENTRLRADLQQLHEEVGKFEVESGVSIRNAWRQKNQGAYIRTLMEGTLSTKKHFFESLVHQLKDAIISVEKVLELAEKTNENLSEEKVP